MQKMMIPTLQAKLENLPVERWKAELAKIEDTETRKRVRNHLKTVYKLREKRR